MKIAIISDAYFDQWNTASSHIAVIENGLRELGHEVIVFTTDIHTKRIIEEDTFIAFPGTTSYGYCGQGISFLSSFSVASRLSDFDPDLVHIHSLTMLSYNAVKYAYKNDIPVVTTVFDLNGILPEPQNNRFFRAVNRIRYRTLANMIFKKSDKVLTFEKKLLRMLSDFCEEEMLGLIPLYADESKYSLKEIDPLSVRDFKESYDIGINKTSILFAGDLSNTILLNSLLEAWSGCVTPSDKLQLILAGDGLDRETLAELAKIHGVASQINFLEEITRDDMPICFAACDAFIMPTDEKAVYIQPIEAIACGTPVIVNQRSLSANFIKNGQNGFVYSNNNDLRKLLQHFSSLDYEGKMLISDFVAKTAEKNSSLKQAKYLNRIYDSLY